ncbi:MAG: DUF308 domain-containing protein [Alphaproteobacteria bacterium]|nr:DUF308 domain-containing protein [Alphaproteobacteria bacterium]
MKKVRDKKKDLIRLAKRVYRHTAPLLLGEAILFTIVALLMMIKPVEFLSAITFVVGAMLVVFGLYRVSMVFVSTQGFTAGTFDVFFGLVTFILGVVFCIYPYGATVGVIYIFIVMFLMNALRLLFFAINVARARIGHHIADIVVSGVLVILALSLLFMPNLAIGVLVWFLAIYLLLYAGADIYMFMRLRQIKRMIRNMD